MSQPCYTSRMIQIRNRKPEDAPTLADIERGVIRVTAKDFYSPTVIDLWVESIVTENFQKTDPDWIHFVATEDNRIVGFVNFSRMGRIGAFYVDKDHVRQGIGSALMKKIEEQAKQWKIQKLDCLASLNAQSFYEKHRFRFVEKREHPLTESVRMTVHRMEKDL